MNKLLKPFVVAVMLLSLAPAFGQLAQFKAMYVYNFAKNIGWPESDSGNDFVIAVVGDSELAVELIKLSKTRMVGNRKVTVKKISSAQEASSAQMVYVSESKNGMIPSIASSVNKSKTVIVSGKQGLCSVGAHISFVLVDDKLSYEISEHNLVKTGLAFSKKLTQLGRVV